MPRGMLLNYGAFDAGAHDLPDGLATPAGFTLTHEEMRCFWRNDLRGPEDAANPRADLVRADVSGLAPALMVVAECDTLYAENLAMAQQQ